MDVSIGINMFPDLLVRGSIPNTLYDHVCIGSDDRAEKVRLTTLVLLMIDEVVAIWKQLERLFQVGEKLLFLTGKRRLPRQLFDLPFHILTSPEIPTFEVL